MAFCFSLVPFFVLPLIMNLFLIMNILDVEKTNDGGLEKKLCWNKHRKSVFDGEIV